MQRDPYHLNDQTIAPATLYNRDGKARVLLVCEHASKFIPDEYADLGLEEDARSSHIAWDPGALGVALNLSVLFDARLVASTVSRLVYDCNRPPEAADAIREKGETHVIPGNTGLSPTEREIRAQKYYHPFRKMLERAISDSPHPPVIVTIHSFTPVYLETPRKVEIGILHDTDARLADAMLNHAGAHTGMSVHRNEPYNAADGVTHTLKLHALKNGLLNVMIEIRNDLISTEVQQREVAEILAGILKASLRDIPDDNSIERSECTR